MSARTIRTLLVAAAILGGFGGTVSLNAAHAQQNQAPAPGQETSPGMMPRGGGGMMGGGMMGNGDSGTMGGGDMQQMMERCRTMMQGGGMMDDGMMGGDRKEMMDRCRGTTGSSSPPAGAGGSPNPPPASSAPDKRN